MQPQPPAMVLKMQPSSDCKELGKDFQPLSAQLLAVKDYVLWSVFNLAFCNCCCLGFAALVASVKSRDCKVVGDIEGASFYGKRARWLNSIELILSILSLVIFIALIISGTMFYFRKKIYDSEEETPG